jgi:hypothetical protein
MFTEISIFCNTLIYRLKILLTRKSLVWNLWKVSIILSYFERIHIMKILIVCITVLSALPAFAGNKTWDFTSSGAPLNRSVNGNSLSMTVDGITLTVTG